MLSLALLQKKVPDGDVRNQRGAKKGGYTDHIAGPHLIPNVGREAMVPAECVRRQPRPVRKEPPKAPPPVLPPKVVKLPKKRQHDEKGQAKERRRRSPSKRSRSRSRSRRRSSSSDDDSGEERRRRAETRPEEAKRAKSPDAAAKRRAEEEQQRQRQREIEAYREAERNRQEQERMKLEAFKEAQMKRKELDTVRKKRLSGAFALDEDDIPEVDSEGKPPKNVLATIKLRPSTPAIGDTPGAGGLPYAGGSSASAPEKLRGIGDGDKVTAADLDGSQHDHKFSAVWKDWNAQKRDDPGEIAKQFMKIAAIKRRGFDPLSRGGRR